jgi:hypothetical protein
MTLAIVVNLVLGVVLVGLLALRLRPDTVTVDTPEEAMRLFRTSFPDAVGRAVPASDGRGALIELDADAGLGLLLRSGRRWNARHLAARDLASVRSTNEVIEIRFKDFAWPRARLRFDDAATRAAWSARIEGMLLPPRGSSREEMRHA